MASRSNDVLIIVYFKWSGLEIDSRHILLRPPDDGKLRKKFHEFPDSSHPISVRPLMMIYVSMNTNTHAKEQSGTIKSFKHNYQSLK